MVTCKMCKHHYTDMDNNDRCENKHYPESNIVRNNWGQWKVDATKCNDFDIERRKANENVLEI